MWRPRGCSIIWAVNFQLHFDLRPEVQMWQQAEQRPRCPSTFRECLGYSCVWSFPRSSVKSIPSDEWPRHCRANMSSQGTSHTVTHKYAQLRGTNRPGMHLEVGGGRSTWRELTHTGPHENCTQTIGACSTVAVKAKQCWLAWKRTHRSEAKGRKDTYITIVKTKHSSSSSIWPGFPVKSQ